MKNLLKLVIFMFFLSGCATTYSEKEVYIIKDQSFTAGYKSGYGHARDHCVNVVAEKLYDVGYEKGYSYGWIEGNNEGVRKGIEYCLKKVRKD